MSKIRESARGEICQIRIPFVCSHDPAETVWCHANGSAAGKGIGAKSNDLLGAYGCFRCHGVYDRAAKTPEGMTRTDVELAFWEGHARSIVKLADKGLIKY